MYAYNARIPLYDIFGCHRAPLKDGAHPGLNSRVKTLSELTNMRHQLQKPHLAHDLDGDGVVSQKDFFLSRHFDMAQRCGDLANPNPNPPTDIATASPPNPRMNKIPMHRTWTEMRVDRMLDRRLASERMKESWDRQHPFRTTEPTVMQERTIDNPGFAHILGRAVADQEEQRVKSGLFPTSTSINPDRDDMVHDFGYRTCPEFHTASGMLKRKKDIVMRDLLARRSHHETVNVPISVRHSHTQYTFEVKKPRKRDESLMKFERKRERREYDMAHFGFQQHQHPRYSDHPQPFWSVHSKPVSVSVPDLVENGLARNDLVQKFERTNPVRIRTGPPNSYQQLGAKMSKRWSEQVFAHKNLERIFDQIKGVQKQENEALPVMSIGKYCRHKRSLKHTCDSTRKLRKANVLSACAKAIVSNQEMTCPRKPSLASCTKSTAVIPSKFQTIHSRGTELSMMDRATAACKNSCGVRSSGFQRLDELR